MHAHQRMHQDCPIVLQGVVLQNLTLYDSGAIAMYQKRDRFLEEVALDRPARGIVPVLVAVGFRGDNVEGMTPSPDYISVSGMLFDKSHKTASCSRS